VFGYPGGGPLEISPFEVARAVTATGRDLYESHRIRRQVFFLSAELRPGDSGAALVDPNGDVVGVAFAIAPDRRNVAYALTTEELGAVLGGDLGGEVDTGPCL
jgi:S1-C subfamily serine protease